MTDIMLALHPPPVHDIANPSANFLSTAAAFKAALPKNRVISPPISTEASSLDYLLEPEPEQGRVSAFPTTWVSRTLRPIHTSADISMAGTGFVGTGLGRPGGAISRPPIRCETVRPQPAELAHARLSLRSMMVPPMGIVAQLPPARSNLMTMFLPPPPLLAPPPAPPAPLFTMPPPPPPPSQYFPPPPPPAQHLALPLDTQRTHVHTPSLDSTTNPRSSTTAIQVAPAHIPRPQPRPSIS